MPAPASPAASADMPSARSSFRVGLRPVLIAGLGLAALVGCATQPVAVSGGYKVGEAYQVDLGGAWADATKILVRKDEPLRMLTIDGPQLNQLLLSTGVADGQGLIGPERMGDKKDLRRPIYRKDMSETEWVELIVDTLVAYGYERVEARELQPANLGGVEAVRFDFSALRDDGLAIEGFAVVAAHKDKLYPLIFFAPKEHYFAARKEQVEKLLASAKFLG